MKRRLLILLLCCPCFGQTWSGIVSSSRAIDWSHAGLPATFPDGETTTNPWTPPVRTQCGSTVAAGTSVATLQTLYNACANGTYLLLGAGTFTIDSRLNLYGRSATLRGSGPMQTTLNFINGATLFMAANAANAGVPLTSDSNYAAGSTTIKISGGVAPAVGQTAFINQCNTGQTGNPCTGAQTDNSGVFVCDDVTACTEGQSRGFKRAQVQTVLVTSVTSLGGGLFNIGISPGLYMSNWAFSQTPLLVWNQTQFNGVGVGLEAMTIQQNTVTPGSYGGGVNWLIEADWIYASWVKGVRFVGSAASAALRFQFAKSSLSMNNYFYYNPLLTTDYGPMTQTEGATDNLFLNNMSTLGMMWEGIGGGDQANVFAFNYVRDMFTNYEENAFFEHEGGQAMDLFEGNQTGVITEDATWGSGNLNTYFRNYLECWDPPYANYIEGGSPNGGNTRGLSIDNYHRFMNAVGNAIGANGWCTGYQGSTFGNAFRIDSGDSLVTSTLMRWGNVTNIPQSSDLPTPNTGIRFNSSEVPSSLPSPNVSLSNPVPSNNNLPASFFLSTTAHPSGGTGLSFWRVCTAWTVFPTSCSANQAQPFPPMGPDVTGGSAWPGEPSNHVNGFANDIPAAVAYRYLPIDPAYQVSHTVSGSSWSAGVETITGISPAFTPFGNDANHSPHTQGGFQLPGTPSACNPSGGELFITAATVTSVSYALAVDPGTNCATGATFKFPDIRQFDERVFQSDPPGLTFSPTSVAFTPQQVNTTSSGRVVTITNSAAGTVTLTSEVVQSGPQFAVSANDCGGSLAPSAVCHVTLTFTPSSAIVFNDNLVVTSNGSGSPQSVLLSGSGILAPAPTSHISGTGTFTGTNVIH